jgi:hypothetical protein
MKGFAHKPTVESAHFEINKQSAIMVLYIMLEVLLAI